jgi:hypothetical protein
MAIFILLGVQDTMEAGYMIKLTILYLSNLTQQNLTSVIEPLILTAKEAEWAPEPVRTTT